MLAAAAALVALIAAPGASAKRVHVHVNIKDQNGYRMSIEAARSAGRVIGIASHKVEGANASAGLRAVSRQHATEVAHRTKASDLRHRSNSGFLAVQVENHHAISTYEVQGTVTRKRLFADLGDLGRISLHFHLRHTRTIHHRCSRQHERLGVFKGRLRFRGEDDYVNVDARELHGKVEIAGGRSRRCGRVVLVPPRRSHGKAEASAKPDRRHRKSHRYTVLYADKEARSAETFFAAIKESRAEAEFVTYVFEDQGPVFINREEYGDGKAVDFRTSKGLRTARIKPSPRAFRGSGHFRAHHKRDHNRWKGPLATSMPGAPHVRLAGRRFDAQLRQFDLSGVRLSARGG
jgi:hypothetical protein